MTSTTDNMQALMQFDYVIIGAGTAGCVLANRLSSDPNVHVCLLEAGPKDNTPLVHIPSFVGTLLFHKTYSWGYKTVPQTALGGREVLLPRGRVMGGCSSTNGMAYFRGHPTDFDQWAEMGNPGWSFREVLPYFTRSENNLNYKNSIYHGNDGEMCVSHIKEYNPMVKTILSVTEEMGYPRCDDFNGVLDPVGFDVRQNAICNGRRVSSVTSFLTPEIKSRKNLTILPNCFVNKIIIKDKNAIGVEIEMDGSRQVIKARQEVLLCAGAYGSPAILQHSGIGDSEALQALDIDVEQHLPNVGKNLHDHPSSVVQMATKNSESYGVSWKALPRNAWSVLQYLLQRKGQFAGNLFEVTGFLRTTEGLDRPDVQFVFMPSTRPTPNFPFPIGHGYGINSILLRPKSRGSVSLKSKDYRVSPLIDTNFLGDEADLEPLMRGIRISRKILAQSQFDSYKSNEILPGINISDDSEIKDYIKQTCTAVHHPGGSCRMGSDADSVVDPELKVRGINRLRVVDASIFPTIMSGNTNAGAVMVAEKAVDIILGRSALPAISAEELE